MRKSLCLFLLAAAAATAPVAAQKLGQRTAAPEKSMSGIGQGSSDAEIARELEAAAAFPVGTLQNPIRVAGPEGLTASAVVLSVVSVVVARRPPRACRRYFARGVLGGAAAASLLPRPDARSSLRRAARSNRARSPTSTTARRARVSAV